MNRTDSQWRILRPLVIQGSSYWKGEPGAALLHAEPKFIDALFFPLKNGVPHWTKMRNQILGGKLSFLEASNLIVEKFDAVEPGLPLREWVEGFIATLVHREAWLSREMSKELREKADALIGSLPQSRREPLWASSPSTAAVKTYALTDGQDVMATRVMTADEYQEASRRANAATDGAWSWGEIA